MGLVHPVQPGRAGPEHAVVLAVGMKKARTRNDGVQLFRFMLVARVEQVRPPEPHRDPCAVRHEMPFRPGQLEPAETLKEIGADLVLGIGQPPLDERRDGKDRIA